MQSVNIGYNRVDMLKGNCLVYRTETEQIKE